MSRLAFKRGKYGRSKYKAFSVLLDGDWISVRMLVYLSGISYYSIGRHLKRWCEYGYLTRRTCLVFGEGDYEYKLKHKAKTWLALARAELPAAGKFQAELDAWTHKVETDTSDLFSLPFKKFVSAIKVF